MIRFAILFLFCAGFLYLLFSGFRSLTDVGALRTHYPQVVYDKKTGLAKIDILPRQPASWVPLKSIQPLAVAAIVISEDWAFWQHNGFDWNQMMEAMAADRKSGHFKRGGSTISQQVVKNVFLSQEKTLWRKLKEAVLTVRLERHLNKKRILEIYLNVAEFGPGIYGVGPAAHYYFQKTPAELNAKEGAFLAMLLPSPKRYGISFKKKQLTPFAQAEVRSILEKLVATKRINEENLAQLMATPMAFETAAPILGEPARDSLPDEEQGEEGDGVEDAISPPNAEDASPHPSPPLRDQKTQVF